jgi:hypothetical protein
LPFSLLFVSSMKPYCSPRWNPKAPWRNLNQTP